MRSAKPSIPRAAPEPLPPLPTPLGPAELREPNGAPSGAELTEPVQRRLVDGLAWTFRQGFGPVLERMSAAAWSDPAQQGWQQVKHNSTRTVWRAEIDGVVYYLKYYGRQGWRGAFRRLWRGPACEIEFKSGLYALNRGIRAVRPAGYTKRLRCGGRVCALLVTEAVEPAYPLNEYWETVQSDDDAARRRRDTAYLIDLLAEMIAHAHQTGFEHRDMHAANILVHPVAPGRYEAVFVDLQSARLGSALSDRSAVRNLAQLNQWFRWHSGTTDRLRFLRRYLRWRNEYEQACEHARSLDLSFSQLVDALIENAARHARRLWAKRDRRAQRSNRYFSRIKVRGGWRGVVFLRCKRHTEESPVSAMSLDRDWWVRQLEHPLRWFDPQGSRPCKESHSAWVSRAVLSAEDSELPVIVKRSRARNWRRRLRHLLRPSRSLRGWRIGNALVNRRIPTARPLAVLERRVGPLVLDSVLLTEGIPGAVDLEMYLRREFEARTNASWWRHKRELNDLLVRNVRQLAERGFVHRDCKAQNLLVVTQPRLKLLWIDMDGLKQVKRPSVGRQFRALVRLHVSLLEVPGLTRTDRVRFLKDYLVRHGRDSRAWRDTWRELSHASQEKIRAWRRRREWKLKHYGRE